jgi:hypothetical protein
VINLDVSLEHLRGAAKTTETRPTIVEKRRGRPVKAWVSGEPHASDGIGRTRIVRVYRVPYTR